MTFDEWWKDNEDRMIDLASYPRDVAKEAWEAATAAERTACATKAYRRGVIAAQLGQAQAEACAKDIYDEIVRRSND